MTVRQHNISFPLQALSDICARFPVRTLSVFGSVLRDDFSADSDIDMLVEFRPRSGVGLITLLQLKFALQDLMGRPVDLRAINDFPDDMKRHILESAEPLYVME